MRLAEIDDPLHGCGPSVLRFVGCFHSVALFKIVAFIIAEYAVLREKDGVIVDPLLSEIVYHFGPDVVVPLDVFFTFSGKEPALPHDSLQHVSL